MNAAVLSISLFITQSAVDPPVAGRPADWAGAIGGPFVVTATAEPTTLTAEEPLTFTIRIAALPSGASGNLREVPRPPLAKLEAFRAFAVEDLDDLFVDEPPRREFRYRLRPRSAEVTEVAHVKFVYFNPRLPIGRGYQTTYSDEVPLMVNPRRTVPTASELFNDVPDWLLERPTHEEMRGQNTNLLAVWIDTALDRMGVSSHHAPWQGQGGASCPMIAIALAAPTLTCALWFIYWRRRNPTALRLAQGRRSRAAAAALRRLRTNKRGPAEAASAALLAYVHDRFGVSAATPADVSRELVGRAPDALAVRAVALLRECDAIRFAPTAASHPALTDDTERLIFDWEASPWPSLQH